MRGAADPVALCLMETQSQGLPQRRIGPERREDDVRMSRTRSVALLAAAIILGQTGGCRENEQNRPLDFQPHVYQGQKPAPLNDDQKRALQERGGLQR
jgi:hypothetical protein